MAKPIAVVKLDLNKLNKQMNFGDREVRYMDIERWVEERIREDYHVLILPCTEITEPIELQVFHEKDFTDIQYEELKQMVQDAIDKAKK